MRNDRDAVATMMLGLQAISITLLIPLVGMAAAQRIHSGNPTFTDLVKGALALGVTGAQVRSGVLYPVHDSGSKVA